MKRTATITLSLIALIIFTGCRDAQKGPGGAAEMDGMEQAMRQQFLMTRDLSLNAVPTERLLVAREQMDMMIAARGQRIAALNWQERGPRNIGGRTRAIIVDQRDATGNTVLAASVSGGIFKTTNFTATTPLWAPVNDQMQNLAVTAMAQDRNNPAVMYAGTGEGWFNVDAVRGAGVFKSTDGGATWNRLASTAQWEYVQDMIVDNNGNVFASLRNGINTFRGVMRSADGGISWVQVLGLPLPNFSTGRAADLEVASNGDVYATLGIFSPTMVMRSSFAVHGAATGSVGTWVEITPQKSTPTQRGELAIAPSNPNRLYLLLQDSATSQVSYIYRSFNAGTTWDSLPAPAALNNAGNSQTWYNLIAAVDPSNPDIITVGGLNLARSTDAGANWTTISTNNTVHVDQHVLIYLSSTRLIVGNDGGVYYTQNANGTPPTFANKNNGFNVTQFYGADYHPSQPNYFLAGAQDNNTQQFTQPGINTTQPVVGGDGGFPHIDQNNDGAVQIASTTGNNYYRSLNEGQFSYLSSVSNNRGQFINPTDYDDVGKVLYCGDDAGRYYAIRNLDQPTVAAVAGIVPGMGTREVTAVRVDPFTPNTVWLGASLGGNPAMVFKLSNANAGLPSVVASFTFPTTGANAIPANAYLSSIDVDPSNGNNVVAVFSNFGVKSVFLSTDGGVTFNNIEGNLPDMPVYWVLIPPANALLNGATGGTGGIMLGTDLGVWTTSAINGTGTQWIPNTNGFPNVRTDMLKYRPADRLVLAATHGRGLFTTNLPAGSVGIPTIANTRNFIKYIAAEQNKLLVVTGSLNTRNMRLEVVDMQGRVLYSAVNAYRNTTINTAGWSNGNYVLRAWGGNNERFTQQFIKR